MIRHLVHQQRSTLRLLLFFFGLLQVAWASNRPIRNDLQRSSIHDIFSPTSPAYDSSSPPAPLQPHQNLKRQTSTEPIRNLTNGNAHNLNIEFGFGQYWAFSRRELFSEPEYLISWRKTKEKSEGKNAKSSTARVDLKKRQEDERPNNRTVYISFNTCKQPLPTNETLGLHVPSLELYVSTNRRNIRPGPKVTNMDQQVILIDEGLGTLVLDVEDEFYLGVYAPNMTDPEIRGRWKGEWNYEIAVSTESLVHQFSDKQEVFLIDIDSSSALLISSNLTENASEEVTKTPYELYGYNNGWRAISKGLDRSYCAIRQHTQGAGGAVRMSITKRGPGGLPKQQFHMTSLNKTSQYRIFAGKKGDPEEGRAPAGGTVWRPLTLNTKSDGNCQVIFDLNFCSEVAYAVPSNPTIFPQYSDLAKFYDDIAIAWYQNFTTSLQQIPCNATNDSKYSLAKSCTDCANDYKTWLCAVTIPRCADFSQPGWYLQPRGVGTKFYNKTAGRYEDNEEADSFTNRSRKENLAAYQSRNKLIDEIVKPGPYKEIKPCIDLCYSMVQSCPTNFGFSCPKEGTFAMLNSYGQRADNLDGDIKCSYLGAAFNLAGVEGLFSRLSWGLMVLVTGMAGVMVAGVL